MIQPVHAQGARFNVRATDPLNTAFVSQWDNYPRNVTVELLDAQVQVRSPKLTVGSSQSSYILMTYRVVGAGERCRLASRERINE